MNYKCKKCGNVQEFYVWISCYDKLRLKIHQDEKWGTEEFWDPAPDSQYTIEEVECVKCKSKNVVNVEDGIDYSPEAMKKEKESERDLEYEKKVAPKMANVMLKMAKENVAKVLELCPENKEAKEILQHLNKCQPLSKKIDKGHRKV